MNCILYARVSTEKQADKDLSIPAQLQAMRDYAQRHTWSIVEEFVEPGVSARTANRPVLQRLLTKAKDVESGVNVVLVHKIDRLARNVYDHATIRALLKQRGIRLASVVENVEDTVSGELVENIMASIAQFYSANLGEEVKKGMRQKVLQGGWPHLPALGYTMIRSGDSPKATIEIDPVAGPLVRLGFELYASGRWGVRALAEHLRQVGLKSRTGKSLAQSYVRRMLVNPFFAGLVRWEGKEFPGRHPALVSPALFARVQEVIRKRYLDPKTAVGPTAFPLKVVAKCASCRGSITAEMHGAWSYYRCRRRMADKQLCPARLCNAKLAHLGVATICQQLRLPAELASQIDAAAVGLIAARTEALASTRRLLQQQRHQLIEREMKLTKSFVETTISPETYEALSAALRQERVALESHLDGSLVTSDRLIGRVREILNAAADVWDLFGRLAPARQVELLRLVFEVVVLGPRGVVGHVLREPFASIFSQATDRPAGHGPNEVMDPADGLAKKIVSVAAEATA